MRSSSASEHPAPGLVTPTTLMVGILIHGAEALELTHRLDAVILDKTGPLTEGKPAVTNTVPGGVAEDEPGRPSAAARRGSEHQLAHAVPAPA